MLPQCVLCPPSRGGRKHHKAAAAYTKDRLQRWLEGDYKALWHDRHQPPRRGGRNQSSDQKRELAIALAREGFDRKACNALVSEGLCSETPETAEALRTLHPAQPAVLLTLLPYLSPNTSLRMKLPEPCAHFLLTLPPARPVFAFSTFARPASEARPSLSWSSLLLLSTCLRVGRPCACWCCSGCRA